MLIHVVLFRPKPSLDRAARQALVDSLREARHRVPAIRRFRVGRRPTGGPAYGHPGDFPYCALIEFDDLEGLHAYLQHPAHQRLGDLFGQTADAAIVCDFAVRDADEVEALIDESADEAAGS